MRRFASHLIHKVVSSLVFSEIRGTLICYIPLNDRLSAVSRSKRSLDLLPWDAEMIQVGDAPDNLFRVVTFLFACDVGVLPFSQECSAMSRTGAGCFRAGEPGPFAYLADVGDIW